MTDLFKYLCICVAVAGWAGAATFYVDSVDGLDDPTHSGGPGDPWLTLSYALSRVSGENTFMCRGIFEEYVSVTRDDSGVSFISNPGADLIGRLRVEQNDVSVSLTGFNLFGPVSGGGLGSVRAEGCFFNYPQGTALVPGRYYGSLWATSCVFENCVAASRQNYEYGEARFEGCVVRDCGEGVELNNSPRAEVANCEFRNVVNAAISAVVFEEWVWVRGSRFYGCGTGVYLRGLPIGCGGGVTNCTFGGNGVPISIEYSEEDYGGFDVEGNAVTDNVGTGISLSGVRIKLRGNVVTGNGGHGVYIGGGDPDLGTPGDPGGNTFAGNGSGYDVYNASAEDIMAYGNTWDPQSREEMAGKTWADVNVTRIYDRWDDPSVGYVKWSDYSTVTPASLGGVKASFAGGAVPASVPAPGMRFD